ncbi:prefoldin subunit 6-like [Anneissia japonica]|uniref:prefoldin subunit 6-like n=1 Tax=Anneissia japonica TaxID=1529436 RepID=UPI0014256D61|nr:prefoldin subunit 6-like [Anneissia japonica]
MGSEKEQQAIQKKLQEEVNKLRAAQKEYQMAATARQQLDAQMNENTIVKDELNLLEPDCKVYKMLGPVLVPQDLVEAKQTVSKRIEYIGGELKRQEKLIEDIEKKQEVHRERLTKLQQDFQKLALVTPGKS